MFSRLTIVIFSFLCALQAIGLHGAESTNKVEWHDDYFSAMDAAEGKLLLIWFYDPSGALENDRFESQVLAEASIADTLARRFVIARLPLDATIESGGKRLVLLDHGAFAELRRRPGLVILDLTEPAGPLYRLIVSALPLEREPLSAEKLATLLDLPRGTLTQRTLIYAVRTHADRPASAASHLSSLLVREADSHAQHQARLGLQGHHQWEQRFHAINAQLPARLLAQEVCAESWPGQELVAAAEECVASWRQSPGHWDAVSRRHLLFGYDMHRGTNGVWYATGIFAD